MLDVNTFMHKIMAEKKQYGITHAGLSDGLYEFCDGYSDEDWDLCMEKGQGEFLTFHHGRQERSAV